MFDKPKTSRVCRNARLMATVGWLIASFAAAAVPPPPPPPPTVSVSPAEITGGTGSINVLVPMSPPSTAASTVVLTSSLPAVASVPSSVFVPAGSSSFSYTVATSPVATDTSVQISARVFNVSIPGAVATLRVLAPVLTSLYIDPPSAAGEGRFVPDWLPPMGIVSINAPAPAGGLSIALVSSNPAAPVASSVSISAGSMSARFPIYTHSVSAPTVAEISVRLGTIAKSATLELLLRVVAASIDPISVLGGQTAMATLTLSGPAPIGGTAVQVDWLEYMQPGTMNDVCKPFPQLTGDGLHVIVPAGSTSVAFPVSTFPSFPQERPLRTTYGGEQRWWRQLVNEMPDTSRTRGLLAVSSPTHPAVEAPPRIKGGTGAVAKIRLEGVAPSASCGQYVFALQLTGAAAGVPAQVFLLGGTSEVLFPITTTNVKSDQPVTLSVTASYVPAVIWDAAVIVAQPLPVTIVVTP